LFPHAKQKTAVFEFKNNGPYPVGGLPPPVYISKLLSSSAESRSFPEDKINYITEKHFCQQL